MDYYVVIAVSEEEERNVSCDATNGHTEICIISTLNDNVYDYNFSAYGVSHTSNSFRYGGASSTECCKLHIFITIQHCSMHICCRFAISTEYKSC